MTKHNSQHKVPTYYSKKPTIPKTRKQNTVNKSVG